jgi:MoxR-like ATPase
VLSLVAAARAWALWDDRTFVTPGDVRAVLKAVLSHRLVLKTSMQGAFSREEGGQRGCTKRLKQRRVFQSKKKAKRTPRLHSRIISVCTKKLLV